VLFSISKVNPLDPLPREQTITVKDFAEAMGMDEKNAYRHLYDGIDSLYNASVKFKEGDWEIETRWVATKAKRSKGSGAIRFKWGEEVHAGLCNVRNGFKSYQLRNIAKLDTSHAIRLYEILLRYKDTGIRIIKVDELKEMLGIPDKYPVFNDFKRYTIEPAVKQLNAKSNINVKYINKKQGRKVSHLVFTFTFENQLKLALDGQIDKPRKAAIEADENAKNLVKNYGSTR
jgi:plasmid replication initiation protein